MFGCVVKGSGILLRYQCNNRQSTQLAYYLSLLDTRSLAKAISWFSAFGQVKSVEGVQGTNEALPCFFGAVSPIPRPSLSRLPFQKKAKLRTSSPISPRTSLNLALLASYHRSSSKTWPPPTTTPTRRRIPSS